MALSNLRHDAEAHGVTLDAAEAALFERYAALLSAWSGRANLVADARGDVVARRHFLESLAFGAALRQREILRPDSTLLDIGSGAGFPGVALKIAWPQVRLTLLEATAKKTAFLAALIADLPLSGVRVLTGRAEELARDVSLRGAFDLVVARAVAPLPVLLELGLPFARIGGRLATVKGSRVADEVAASSRALDVLGARTVTFPLQVAGPPQQIVVAVKLRETPDVYPRRAGVPKKHPL
ncbi:MAG: 16S rRNA (guanine(527)-N(7))-methyltransferase RsmG [Dehalococcoidia bacterium]